MLIAGPNLTIDRTATLPELRPGEVLRFDRVVVTPGGKGLNVARAARALGVEALLAGFVPGETGRAAAGMIGREGVALRSVPCRGELRSTAIVMEHGGRTTVLNEPGPRISADEWAAYEAAIAEEIDGHGVLVCSGSVPPGSPEDAYARLTAIAVGAGCRCVVDAAGTTLARALEAHPDVVCPNIVEAEEALGAVRAQPVRSSSGAEPRAPGAVRAHPVRSSAGAEDRALVVAAALVARGAKGAIVTADAAGAAVASSDGERAWLPAPRITEVRNPIGAGDVLASALAAALERGEPLLEAARRGVAAAAASVEWPTAGELDAARADELLLAVRAG